MVIALFLVLFAFVYLLLSIKIVKQSSIALVERLGKFHKQLDPGFRLIVPGIDSVRTRVNLKTLVLESPAQDVITKDNVGVKINTVVWYRITEPFKAVYEIDNLKEAVINIIATTLRDSIGGMELDECLSSRDTINVKLRDALDEVTGSWGCRIERVEVKDIEPPRDIIESMQKQMRAERERRETVLMAQGVKESQILEAQGRKEAVILEASAKQEAQVLTAKGQADAIRMIAEAESSKIKQIYEAYASTKLSKEILTLESINAMKKMAESNNKMLIPYESAALMGSINSLKEFSKFDDKNK